MPSLTLCDPVRIVALSAGAGHGRVGIALPAGESDPDPRALPWHRDLSADLDAMRQWGACTIVSFLAAPSPDPSLVLALHREAARHHMEWLHFPVTDTGIAGPTFEAEWRRSSEGLRDRLRHGFDIVIHGRGCRDLAAMIAARLLVELGMQPGPALMAVREEIPGACVKVEHERHVQAQVALPERQPDTSLEAIRDRALGAMLGLAIGDAVGTTLEFESRDSYEPLSDMVGGGPFDLQPGEWTDDTAMSLALAESLVACGTLDEADLLARFRDWYRNGTYSCTGTCFDIGGTTRYSLMQWEATAQLHCGPTDPRSAGNGSLMRLAPVAVRFWRDRSALKDAAARQSRTTHGVDDAVDACVIYAQILADAIEGAPRTTVLRSRDEPCTAPIERILRGSWRGRARSLIRSSGYVVHSMEASLWSVARTADFRGAVLTAANLGIDADTTAAITGQLAGALQGASGLPEDFLARLAWRERIERAAMALFEAGR